MPIDARYLFHLPTPSSYLDTDEKVLRLHKDMNRILDQLGLTFRDITGLAGRAVQLFADLDMGGNRITNVALPIATADATNKTYVDGLIDELRQIIEEILNIIHNELPVGGRDITLTRVVPTTVNDTIDIGTFTLTNDAHNLDIALTISDTTFSVAKRYLLTLQRGINTDWQLALPLIDTGAGSSQDVAIDVKQTDASSHVEFRLRRTVGTTAGTATLHIQQRGKVEEAFAASTATASVSAPTDTLENATLSEIDGNVLVTHTSPSLLMKDMAATFQSWLSSGTSSGVFATNINPFTANLDDVAKAAWAISQTVANTWRVIHATAGTNPRSFSVFFGIDANGNVGVGTVTFGTSAVGSIAVKTGTDPTGSVADQFAMYSADATAGNAAPHFKTETGDVIKLFKGGALTSADTSALSAGGTAVLSNSDSGVIDNMRTRILDLETRLKAVGLLA